MVVIILFLIGFNTMLPAANPDSLSCHYDHSISAAQLVAPVSLILPGIAITSVPALHCDLDFTFRDHLQADDHDPWRGDNYLQYVPLVMPLTLNLCGLKGEHQIRDLICLTAGTYLIGAILVNGLKYTSHVERPYGDSFNSFPSGHTFTAFAGAEILRREFGKKYPWIAVIGYAVATSVGFLRLYNNNHWISDVLAGAGFGILSASLSYWIDPYLRF